MHKKSVDELAGEWWSVALRGVFALVAGIAISVSPIPHNERLLRIFGIYLLVDGVLTLLTAAKALRQHGSWWRSAVDGLLGVFLGYTNIVGGGLPAATRADLIALRTCVLGVLGILAARQLRGTLPEALPERLLVLAGVGSVIFSVIIFVGPAIEARVLGKLNWLATLYLVVFGLLLLVIAARLRRLAQAPATAARGIGP